MMKGYTEEKNTKIREKRFTAICSILTSPPVMLQYAYLTTLTENSSETRNEMGKNWFEKEYKTANDTPTSNLRTAAGTLGRTQTNSNNNNINNNNNNNDNFLESVVVMIPYLLGTLFQSNSLLSQNSKCLFSGT